MKLRILPFLLALCLPCFSAERYVDEQSGLSVNLPDPLIRMMDVKYHPLDIDFTFYADKEVECVVGIGKIPTDDWTPDFREQVLAYAFDELFKDELFNEICSSWENSFEDFKVYVKPSLAKKHLGGRRIGAEIQIDEEERFIYDFHVFTKTEGYCIVILTGGIDGKNFRSMTRSVLRSIRFVEPSSLSS